MGTLIMKTNETDGRFFLMDSIKINAGATKMVAHRGLSGIELENTNASFIAAGNRSFFGIETDVHRTADGRFVVIHDDDTARVSGQDLPVEGTDFETLRALPLETADHPARADQMIPTLKEYIATCKRYDKVAVLELKNEFTAEDIRKICDEINDLDYLPQVIFISFAFVNLVYIRELYPAQPVQFLTSKYADDLLQILQVHKFDIDILYTELTPERIKAFHDHGIRVNCWTCDDKSFAETLAAAGIDFISSNILEGATE